MSNRTCPATLPPLPDLLAIAEGRLRRQAQFARPLARARRGAMRALETAFADARRCLLDRARPAGLHLRLTPQAAERAMAPKLTAELAAGGAGHATLVTLGCDLPGAEPATAPEAGRDYLLGHVRALLAQQLLFAAVRAAQADLRAGHPGYRMVRIAQPMAPEAGAQGLWDAAAAQRLLALFGPAPLGVQQTEAGAFQPLHSLIALSVLHPVTPDADADGPRRDARSPGPET